MFSAPHIHPSIHPSVSRACVAPLKTNPPLKPPTDAGRLACHLETGARAGSPSPEGRRLDVTSPLHCMQEEEEGGGGHGRAVIDGPRERPCPATATLPASMLLPHTRDGWSGREEREERARAKSQCGRGGAFLSSRIIKRRKPYGLARVICLAMTDNGWSGWDCNVNRLHLRITSSSSQTHRQRRRRLCNIDSPFPLPPLPLRRLGLARATVRASERVH